MTVMSEMERLLERVPSRFRDAVNWTMDDLYFARLCLTDAKVADPTAADVIEVAKMIRAERERLGQEEVP